MAQHGSVTWTELSTRDVAKAKAFYSATLGLSFTEMPVNGGMYTMIHSPDGPVMAGIFDISGPEYDGVPEGWFTYLAVDDVDARVAKVEPAGGSIVRPPWDIPGVGRIAIVKEPGGGVIGWMKSVES